MRPALAAFLVLLSGAPLLALDGDVEVLGLNDEVIADNDDTPSLVDGTLLDDHTVWAARQTFTVRALRTIGLMIGITADAPKTGWLVVPIQHHTIKWMARIDSDDEGWFVIMRQMPKDNGVFGFATGTELPIEVVYLPDDELTSGTSTAEVTIVWGGGAGLYGPGYDPTYMHQFTVSATRAEANDQLLITSPTAGATMPADERPTDELTLTGTCSDVLAVEIAARWRTRGGWSEWVRCGVIDSEGDWTAEFLAPRGQTMDIDVLALDAGGVPLHRARVTGVALGEQTDETATGDYGDPDADGMTNIVEWAMGTDPNARNTPPWEVVNPSAGVYGIEYPVDTGRPDLRVTPQYAHDPQFGTWTSAGLNSSVIATDGDIETRRALPDVMLKQGYWRLKVERIGDAP